MQSMIEQRQFVKNTLPYQLSKRMTEEGLHSFFPLRARWQWLDSECNCIERILEWKFPFDVEKHAEKFIVASLSGEMSDLPNPMNEIISVDLDVLSTQLGIEKTELEKASSLKLEDLPNGWEFVIKSDMQPYKRLYWNLNENDVCHEQ